MRSLSTKLTLAFLLVGLIGAFLVAFLIRVRIQSAFSQLIENRVTSRVAGSLAQYYQLQGSWQGVDQVLPDFLVRVSLEFGGGDDISKQWHRFVLVGPDLRIVYSLDASEQGTTIPRRDLKKATQILINGQTAGWLLATPAPLSFPANTPEGQYLRAVNTSTIISGIFASALALVLGGLLAYTMTRSLRELTDATVAIAGGSLGRTVKVRSKDELGELALSFNKMSADLARSTNARRQMTADIAHDLRSPLSVISGYAEALSDGKLPGTPEVYDILHQETQQLNRLVEDLRTLSLADAGELSLNVQPVDAHSFLERVVSHYQMAAQQKGIRLVMNAPQGLPTLQLDSERMMQVFDNLISNALRHTPEGGEVRLSIQAVGGSTVFEVKDTGSGISAEDMPRIFDRFYKGDKSRHSAEESGLGLAIARSIVDAHGGRITASSQPGQGAVFTISLPG